MTIQQLINGLKKFPKDMPIAIWGDIDWKSKDDPHHINIIKSTWVHSNYPYDKDDFDYINLE